jgi:hypothetical protein
MILLRRHWGRRVAAVGVATALLVLGLETPAFAAAPTITGFLPISGPVGCVVTITGTNFNNPNVTDVEFNNTNAASFRIDSGTSITAVVGTGTTTGPVEVTNADGTASFGTFTVANTTCPTITSFTPTSGPVGTSVVITGTNFTGATSVTFNGVTATFTVNSATQITATVPTTATTGPIRVTTPGGTGSSLTNFTIAAPTITSFTPTFGPVGTSVVITGTNLTGATAVTFNNVAATTFTVNSPTQITATVPATATTGPIKVTTPGGSATSATNFTVSTLHPRSVTLSLRKHLVARGTVTVGDAFTACVSGVPVKIQRRKSGRWKTVGSTTTSASGSYKKRVRDREGKYRAKAPRVVLNNGVDICSADASPARTHNH